MMRSQFIKLFSLNTLFIICISKESQMTNLNMRDSYPRNSRWTRNQSIILSGVLFLFFEITFPSFETILRIFYCHRRSASMWFAMEF